MSLAVIELEDGGHTYEVDGKRIPSVSEILEGADLIFKNAYYQERAEAAAIRGRDVHMAAQDLDRGFPPWWQDEAEISGYVEAYRQFKKDFEFRPTAIETPYYHEHFRYAGQPDRFGELRNREGPRVVTLDIKCVATVGPHTPIQLAGYSLLADDHEERDMLALQLKKTGKYVVHHYPEREHYTQVFLSCLTLYSWKQRHLKATYKEKTNT